jgi:putative holliday junction resolvase
MRILAVDFGTRRIGLAVCNPEETLVVGAGVIERRKGDDPVPAVAAAAREREAERVVVGLPLNMDGSYGMKAAEAKTFSERLREELKIPVLLHDERLSSAAAEERLRGVDEMTRSRKRLHTNQVAAQVILESYLSGRDGKKA